MNVDLLYANEIEISYGRIFLFPVQLLVKLYAYNCSFVFPLESCYNAHKLFQECIITCIIL